MRGRPRKAFGVPAALLALCLAGPAIAGLTRAELDDVGVTLPPQARLPLAAPFRDAQGRALTLGEAAGGRPVALFPVDYGCRMVCGVALQALAGLVAELPPEAARGWRLLVVGLDPSDGPQEAAAARARCLADLPATAPELRFLTGDAAAIGAVTGAVGYRYAYDAERGEFAHPVAMVLAGRDGRLARMLSPLAARGTDLRLALQESGRAPDGLVQAVRALCYRFDPATGRYTALVDRVMTGLALCSAALLAAGVLWLLRRERRRRRDGAAEAGHG